MHVEARFDASDMRSMRASTARCPWPSWLHGFGDCATSHLSASRAEDDDPDKRAAEWFGVADIGINFADGTQVVVPVDQRRLGEPDRPRSDEFLAVHRAGSGL